MIISYKWLLDYLPEEVSIEKLSKILTSIGLEVEGLEPVEYVKGGLDGLVIGEVLTCEKHPDADKLKVTTVNIGGDTPLNIVCGAPNVAAGQRVVVAPVNSFVHPVNGEAFKIKKAKIRGQVSEGMICAEDEVGLGNDHDGIMVLKEDAVIGTLAKDYFNIPEPDTAIHIGLTPNRSDAMSHIGVAKDVVAYLSYHNGKEYKVQLPEIKPAEKTADLNIDVEVKDAAACPRYMGLTIAGVKVGPSPEWLQRRLQAIGSRPINNVVDITNYILHEWGQPLHAFDADKIKGQKVIVQTLAEGTKFTTLDEEERILTASDLMICNAEGGMCIAGVFGGVHSGVTDVTTNIFLESAFFNDMHIRRTSLDHGLRTDAATHFEKTVDVNNLEPALLRAAQMIVEFAGGQIASNIVDIYPEDVQPKKVTTTYEYINRLSGKTYQPEKVSLLLTALGFTIEEQTNESITVSVPTNKADVAIPADIVEEVLRIDGLDNIPIPERLNISLNAPIENDRGIRNKVADILVGIGFREIVTNSIVNSKYYSEEKSIVKMLNSLTSELDILRPHMLESGLEIIQYNCNRKNNDLLLFEFGKTYGQTEQGYYEDNKLVLYVTGTAQIGAWNRKEQQVDAFYLKGVVEKLIAQAGIKKVNDKTTDNVTVYSWKKKELCWVEEVTDKKLYDFDIKQPVYFATVNWDLWLEAIKQTNVMYAEVSKHPAVSRDLSIVLDKSVTYQQVKAATNKLNINELQNYNLFDVFESDKLGENKKSYALNYTFQLQDRTLTDDETDSIMQKLIDSYKKELQAQIRD